LRCILLDSGDSVNAPRSHAFFVSGRAFSWRLQTFGHDQNRFRYLTLTDRNRSARTVESDLLARKLPPNGIQELMSHVQDKIVWAKSLVEADFTSSDSTYKLLILSLNLQIVTNLSNLKF
jgi:hypothetical protein